VAINRQYLDRISGEWVTFADDGQDFAASDHPYTNDLDVFGPKSLYQWISTAKTCNGRQQLYKLLANPPKDLDTIVARQRAIRELAKRLDFCQNLECRGVISGMAAHNPEELIRYAEEPPSGGSIIRFIRFLPILTVSAFGSYLLDWTPIHLPVALLIAQTFIVFGGYKKVSVPLNRVYSFKESLGAFRGMLELIETEPFQDKYLSTLRMKLFDQTDSASAAMNRLESISNAIDLQYSIYHLVFNIIFLWDIQCALRLIDWKYRYGQRVGGWLEVLGTLEALSSLSVISHIHPDWAFPEIEDQGQKIAARSLGHPLLPPEKCVRNNIEIDNYSSIVTGSNMSGKSTWLRAIGVNLVLAYAGGPVCARRFRCSIMDIYTSMEIRDDLLEGVSTFYAELTRIKMILDHSRLGRPMLYLIDEIFRGTNSLDRITGAQVVLRTLSSNGVIGLISTHDFELCELEKEPWSNFKNYHFEEQYLNGGIQFDYKLRPGRCITSNARYLMNMVGIDVKDK
jgi:DNA mismatch repair ATPase MutS